MKNIKGRRRILTICLEPAVVKNLDAYIRFLSASNRAISPSLGRSTVINQFLRRELKRQGFSPDKPLLGEREAPK